uniref:C-type lectin domain-containing protein n=1 Tax=Caenorhabditis tropicalis TaxID=1561998 RepID=A0A1I7TPZ8_9PELO
MVVLKLLIAAGSLLWIADAQCVSGDSLIGDLCYSFSTTQLSFTDSRDHCHSINQNLAVIHNTQQNNFLASLVRNRYSSSYGRFWIGLSRPALNASFVWDDGTPAVWTNFDSLARDNLFVGESTMDGKWRTSNGKQLLDFVCSYIPKSATGPTTTKATTTTTTSTSAVVTSAVKKPSVTCLFMIDMQSAGIDQNAIATYQTYFNFAKLVGTTLNNQTYFTGNLDNFGYTSQLVDRRRYQSYSFINFESSGFPIDGTDDDIDLDLTEVDGTLKAAGWNPPATDHTCLIFISAAPEAMYGGTSISPTYDSFTTVVGVLVGGEKAYFAFHNIPFSGATSIPGLTDPVITAVSLSTADAESVVQRLLETLP